MLKRHLNVCTGGDLCSSFFFVILLKHPVWRLVLMWGFPPSDEWGPIPFSFVFLDFTSTCGEQPFRACSHNLETAHCLGQLTDHGVNFASVHGLTSVTVHTNFSLPRGTFERRVTHCTTPGNRPFQGNFSPCEQNGKVLRGKSSLAHGHY